MIFLYGYYNMEVTTHAQSRNFLGMGHCCTKFWWQKKIPTIFEKGSYPKERRDWMLPQEEVHKIKEGQKLTSQPCQHSIVLWVTMAEHVSCKPMSFSMLWQNSLLWSMQGLQLLWQSQVCELMHSQSLKATCCSKQDQQDQSHV